MNIELIEMNNDQMIMCAELLPSWQKLVKELHDETKCGVKTIPLLVKYEMDNKRRKNIIDRLLARYYKLKRKHTYNKLCRLIDFREAHAGK